MIDKSEIQKQLDFTLMETSLDGLGKLYRGKVRDNYSKDGKRIIITTDRISAFDVVLGTIPFKGQVLNQMARFWFDKTGHIIGNHMLDHPDPNVLVAKECTPLPVEMIVRGYITGVTNTSAWTHYKNGIRNFCGNILPEGLKKDQKLDMPIVTPQTKAEHGGHDESVSKEEILKRKIVSEQDYDLMSEASLKLYEKGVEIAAKQGIILVDTKYEFGRDESGNIILIDEIHTPDSSRFWFAEGYEERFKKGIEQKKIDKEYVRKWLADRGFTGSGVQPELTDEVRINAARKYIEAYELITGDQFSSDTGDMKTRIENNLRHGGYL
ncbi:phosphoribosylaminoimidazolesuccinocarboxamide synthase [Candidatus Woesearchaeota archaeon]|nr:phosphoribosylaminoimidazolesuccinocarboxamide synthase [Candidatus Woesearchaeota archaeon]